MADDMRDCQRYHVQAQLFEEGSGGRLIPKFLAWDQRMDYLADLFEGTEALDDVLLKAATQMADTQISDLR